MSGQGGALGGRQHLIDVAKKLSQSLGGLVGQLQMRDSRSFQRTPINRILRQRLKCLRMSGLQLRVHRQEVVDGLLYQRRDLRLLCIGGVNLDVQMLQHMIDVSGNIGGAIATRRHPMMKTTCAHPGRGGHPDDAAEESSSGDKGD